MICLPGNTHIALQRLKHICDQNGRPEDRENLWDSCRSAVCRLMVRDAHTGIRLVAEKSFLWPTWENETSQSLHPRFLVRYWPGFLIYKKQQCSVRSLKTDLVIGDPFCIDGDSTIFSSVMVRQRMPMQFISSFYACFGKVITIGFLCALRTAEEKMHREEIRVLTELGYLPDNNFLVY